MWPQSAACHARSSDIWSEWSRWLAASDLDCGDVPGVKPSCALPALATKLMMTAPAL